MKDDVASYQERFQESEQSIQDRRTEAAQDRKIDETLKNDPAAGQQMLEGLIAQYQKKAAAAKAQFEKELQEAQADGKIDDDERKKLDDAHSAYTRAESMVDKYSDRLRSAQDGTREAAEKPEQRDKQAFETNGQRIRHNDTGIQIRRRIPWQEWSKVIQNIPKA